MKRTLLLVFTLASLASAQQSPHGPMTIKCEVCHSTDTWTIRTDAVFNHNSTGFPLAGRHQAVECRSCHRDLVFTATKTDCASCHADIHQKELGPNCLRCHTPESWTIPDVKEQHQETRFPLLGRHRLINCDECHARASSQRYAGTPLACITCHKKAYDATIAPSHAAAGFGVECGTCHRVNTLGWPGGFDHNLTAFPLTGAHRAIICAECHTNNTFDRLSVNCYDCHAADYRRPQSPNHVTGGFSQQCLSCHTTTAWQPAAFDHNVTRFPLTGKHTQLECQSCHAGGNYQLAYTDCYQCHSIKFQEAPNHVTGSFSHNCLTCHTTTGWSPATFSHAATSFPLTGKHAITECQSCHTNGNYQLAYRDCYQCHQTNFEQVLSPNHVEGNFSHNCLSCHNTVAFQPGFDHGTTAFPLTGTHTAIECQSCHTNGNYQLAYRDCYQCHQTNFEQTTSPNHVAGNFSRDCIACHTTAAWEPAAFNHALSNFPLTGAHTTTLCQSCHTSNNYQLTYTDCYQCHQTDFAQPTDPNHVAANFSRNCLPCHTTSAWAPSTFDHDGLYFKIYSGRHRQQWAACATCHSTPSNYAQFTCFNCHTHDKPVTDGHHTGVAGYSYTSAACYNCHRGV